MNLIGLAKTHLSFGMGEGTAGQVTNASQLSGGSGGSGFRERR